MIRFGPAGNSESFYTQGGKSSVEMPAWLAEMGLNAYEYQCGRGVNISNVTAEKLGAAASENDIFMSIHAPYYINLANQDAAKREKSAGYIMDALDAAKHMKAERIIVHVGSAGGIDRRLAFDTALKAFTGIIHEADTSGFGNIAICPEVLGKINQLGSVEEIVEICKLDERLIPTVDFGHLYAREQGQLKSIEDFDNVLSFIGNSLGYGRLSKLHCHFSRIEFTAGGEKKHLMLDNKDFGPEFKYLAEVIIKKKMEPVIICESMGFMAEEALKLKNIYENILFGRSK
jgi:deoxyribonuclease IV